MANMNDIVQDPSDVLRETCAEVPVEDIASEEVQALLKKMSDTLTKGKHWVAIAANQVGVPLRIFVIAGKSFVSYKEQKEGKEIPEDRVFINPVITKVSKETKMLSEGCLSVELGSIYGKVERHLKATIEAYDEKGEKFELGAGGLIAHIFQHEIEHLDGIIFTDKAEGLHKIDADEE